MNMVVYGKIALSRAPILRHIVCKSRLSTFNGRSPLTDFARKRIRTVAKTISENAKDKVKNDYDGNESCFDRLDSQFDSQIYSSPRSFYDKLLDERILIDDSIQNNVIDRLTSLHSRLVAYRPPVWPKEEIVEIRCDKEEDIFEKTKGMKILKIRVGDEPEENYQRNENIIQKGLRLLKNGENSDHAIVVTAAKLKNIEVDAPKGLYIHGDTVGCGKTMCMDIFYKTMPIKQKKRIHFHAFMRHVYSDLHFWSKSSESKKGQLGAIVRIAERLMKDTWLICFDEMQVTDVATAAILSSLFPILLKHGTVIVATSNRPLSSLYISGIQRSTIFPLIDSLGSYCEEVHLSSNIDYRDYLLDETANHYALVDDNVAVDNSSNNVYTTDQDDREDDDNLKLKTFYVTKRENESDAFFNMYKELSKLSTVRPKSLLLPLLGREIYCPTTVDGMVHYSFQELFQQPLGAFDYIEICRHFHTIFLDVIPYLNEGSSRNELRRFITFIDAAYESRCKVVFLAEDDIDALFVNRMNPTDSILDLTDIMQLEMVGDMLDDLKPEDRNKLEMTDFSLLTGEEEKFAIKRTKSRLREMSSTPYLGMRHIPQEMYQSQVNPNTNVSSENREHSRTVRPELNNQVHQGMQDDFGDEASYSNLSYEREKIRQRQKSSPTFDEKHFFGFGWWEEKLALYRKRQAEKNV